MTAIEKIILLYVTTNTFYLVFRVFIDLKLKRTWETDKIMERNWETAKEDTDWWKAKALKFKDELEKLEGKK